MTRVPAVHGRRSASGETPMRPTPKTTRSSSVTTGEILAVPGNGRSRSRRRTRDASMTRSSSPASARSRKYCISHWRYGVTGRSTTRTRRDSSPSARSSAIFAATESRSRSFSSSARSQSPAANASQLGTPGSRNVWHRSSFWKHDALVRLVVGVGVRVQIELAAGYIGSLVKHQEFQVSVPTTAMSTLLNSHMSGHVFPWLVLPSSTLSSSEASHRLDGAGKHGPSQTSVVPGHIQRLARRHFFGA